MNKIKAVEYRRISSAGQSNFSIEGQGAINLKYAEQHEIEIVKTFTDDGVSGKNFDRPQWKAVMKF